jgi:hypothetical protein
MPLTSPSGNLSGSGIDQQIRYGAQYTQENDKEMYHLLWKLNQESIGIIPAHPLDLPWLLSTRHFF